VSPVTVYLVVNDFGEFGRAFVETDIAEADREERIRNFVSGWVRRKNSPSMAGAFGARTGGGVGDDEFALTGLLDSRRRQKVRAKDFTNCD
jgi:hypothetical protein